MTIINDSTVAVSSFDELKECLSGENNYNYIYFDSDITLTSGININKSKVNVTIDGTYNGVRHKYVDMKSASSTSTIYVNSEKNANVTFKNVDVTGYNYYGLIYVPESSAYQNITVEYNNLSYVGPQITYNPSGISRYIDCNIKITASYAAAQEVAECNRVEIGGKTTITHESTSDSSFWFRGNTKQYFKILKNANVTMTSLNRELFYGVNDLEFSVLENATFNLTTALGVGYGTYSLGNVLMDKNASLNITKTKQNGSNPTMYCTGAFVMNESSSLSMINKYSGISASNYNIYFRGTASSLTLNNPLKLVLYNSKARVIYTNSTIPFNFSYSRINMWNAAKEISEAGSIDDIPTYSWYKTSDLSNIVGTLSSSQTVINSNNYTTEELNTLPALTNFNFQNKYAISIGKMKLTLSSVTDESVIISGYTEPLADIKITYLDSVVSVSADSSGYFSTNISGGPLEIGTKITYFANVKNSFIYEGREVTVIYPGELSLDSAPSVIKFSTTPISTNPVICPRLTDVTITVTDSRVQSSNWKLYATINHNLSSSDGYVLTDSLVNVTENGITPLSSTKLLIYQGEDNSGSVKITNITWNENEGILLRIANEPVEQNKEYQATITWDLEE